MTNQEAIEILSQRGWDGLPHGYTTGYLEAIDTAIEALSAERKGEWRPIVLTSYPPKYREMCSCCGFMKNKEAFRFCPICGANMRPDNAPLADDDSIYG